ncbi:MAG: Rieske 2Fe-2S domain-containing protein [Betaproteobacteria bacterium]|nr:Rieske 2Fe-2S domain-containing protein [Betaproteobacteria bacterium]
MADKERLSELGERLTEVNEGLSETSEGTAEASACLICAGGELLEGGDGVRFEIELDGEAAPAFAIRYGGRVYGYLNRCAHIAMELDWKLGKFFDADAEYLICSTHGALYAPESGACRGGPCRGAALVGLNMFEAEGKIYMKRS